MGHMTPERALRVKLGVGLFAAVEALDSPPGVKEAPCVDPSSSSPPSGRGPLAWLSEVNLASFTRLTGWHAEAAVQPLSLEYARAPRRDGSSVVAVLHERGAYKVKDFEVRIDGISPRLSSSCNGTRHTLSPCDHVRRLVGDLSISAELREALIEGEPTDEALRGLPQARARIHAVSEITVAIDRWAAPQETSATLTLEAEVGRTMDSPWAEETPCLVLRFRRPPGRAVLLRGELLRMRLSPDLRRLVALVAEDAGGRRALVASGELAALALELLRDHPEWGVRGLQFSDRPLKLCVVKSQMPEVGRVHYDSSWGRRGGKPERKWESRLVDVLQARWRSDDGTVDVPASQAGLFVGPTSFVWIAAKGTLFPVHPSLDTATALRLHAAPTMPVPVDAWELLHQRLQTRLAGSGVALPTRVSLGLPEAAIPTFVARIDGEPLDLAVTLDATYDTGIVVLPAPLPDASLAAAPSPARNLELEEAAIRRLVEAGLVKDTDSAVFRAQEDAAVAFWQTGLSALKGEGSPTLMLFVAEKLAGMRVRGAVRSRVRASLVGGWLETNVSFEVDDVSAEMSALRDALRKKRRWVRLRDGSLAPLPAEAHELAGGMDSLLDESGNARLSIPQIGLLDHWAEGAERTELDASIGELRARLRSLEVRPAELPEGLQATLRPYQVQGLAWLQFLSELGAGGILADDMGLGKTLMTLAFLSWKKAKKGAGPSLVVCPTSVVGNWIAEAARFAPGLVTLSLATSDRAPRLAKIGQSDLVVTTYGLLRQDVAELEKVLFRTVILDEAQNIKNAGAATTHAARRLRGDQKLALTGTPVENRLGELWSILEYCNPGMLGALRSFETRFERPIATSPGGAAAAELRARVRPFVLRRTKAQVLAELPPKQEIDMGCLPGPAQRKAYDGLAALVREDVESSLRTQGLARSGLIVLTALLRLRQMCCDPRLVDPSRPASLSAKREAFLSLVRELVAEGRRALVFSQFVELFRLWREDLDREGIAYEYLDGSTKKRDEVVARFQNGKAPLFLLSLKAGGSGLNLTAADTVIHCDPWWNPAVEAQATDRTHRIGQTRSVTVYRLVLRGTIEEKIAELKAKKRAIADAVIHEDAGALKGLAEDDVRLLLSGVDSGVDLGVEYAAEWGGDGADDGADKAAGEAESAASRPSRSGRPPKTPKNPASPVGAAARAAVAAPALLEPVATVTLAAPLPASSGAGATVTLMAPAELAADGAAASTVGVEGRLDGVRLSRFAEQVSVYLKSRGLLQKTFAAKAGVSPSMLSQLLRGHLTSLSRPVAVQVLRAMLD